MSAFYRKGTVSKASGPTHMNSYALRGVPIKYKPPIFVPDPLYLPADWKPPEMPSEDMFRYDYATEKQVLVQARSRALSVAAEASLQRQQIEEQLKLQREKEEAEAKAIKESAPPLFSNDILTPTPVLTTTTGPVIDPTPGGSENNTQDESPKSSSQTSIELSAEPPIKSLGQMSIREFESNYIDDPFEIASLQAINDMEVLQSVLQPIPAPIITSSVPSSSSVVVSTPPLTQPSTGLTGTATTVSQSSPIPMPRSRPDQTSPVPVHNSTALYPSSTPPTAIVSSHQSNVKSIPQSGVLAATVADAFLSHSQTSTVAGANIPIVGSPNNPGLIAGATPLSEPGVGLLIDIGDHAPRQTAQPPGRSNTLPAVDQPQGSQFNPSPHPVPKPRTHLPPAVTSSGHTTPTPPYPNSSQLVTPSPSSVQGRPSPPVPPKGIRQVTTPSQPAQNAPPNVPPKGVKPGGAVGHVGFVLPSSNPAPSQGPNRLGLGVQVLPPISKTPVQPPPNKPPPYSSPTTQPRVPPPYSSLKPSSHSPLLTPRAYKLPDPQGSLSSEQKSEVESLSGMGFPPARVARAVLRYEADRSKVLDFLFLVGKVEEEKYAGDSAETALLACKKDATKAVEYLKRVEGFQNIGFLEKKIHEAYEISHGDWDKALDFLTEDR